ncbi:MAG: lipopolysaccharide transport system permease protein [Thermoleophilaceae bacterium]|jgi:lipopolysaccharide transport system permease protein|nr:lipopolysaccharide transport system permease protein [Thermoleophilaceae bacterium]
MARPAPLSPSRQRPSARDVLATLTISDLRARYGRGPWRLVKWLLDPFALVGVYLLLVTVVLDRPNRATGLSLACAVIPFQLLMMTIINALDSVVSRTAIIQNMGFRRALIPLASLATESTAFAASLLLIALMMAVYAVAPTTAIVWLPLVLALNLALAAAAAFPAALIGVWLPDLRTFVVSAVRTLFFVAPGLVAIDKITGDAHDLVKINPLSGLFEAYRDALLYGHAPDAWELLIPLAWTVVLAAVGVPLFRREQRHLAKVVV